MTDPQPHTGGWVEPLRSRCVSLPQRIESAPTATPSNASPEQFLPCQDWTIMSMNLRIEIFSRDLDSFVDFYTNVLRFSLDRDERDFLTPYVSVHRDAVRIGAVPSGIQASPDHRIPPTGTEIVLEVDDLDTEREAIVSRGWSLDADLTVRPWGLRDFRVRDPDGYYLRFTTS